MILLGAIGFGVVVGGIVGYAFAIWERRAYDE